MSPLYKYKITLSWLYKKIAITNLFLFVTDKQKKTGTSLHLFLFISI